VSACATRVGLGSLSRKRETGRRSRSLFTGNGTGRNYSAPTHCGSQVSGPRDSMTWHLRGLTRRSFRGTMEASIQQFVAGRGNRGKIDSRGLAMAANVAVSPALAPAADVAAGCEPQLNAADCGFRWSGAESRPLSALRGESSAWPEIDTRFRQGCRLNPSGCMVPNGSATPVARTRAEKSQML